MSATIAPAVRVTGFSELRSTWRRPTASPRPRSTQRAAGPAPRGQLHLTRRGRVVVWLLGAAVAAGVGGAAASASADGPTTATEVHRIVVAPGDTLWDIAATVAGPDEDVRDVVLQLMDLNRLASGGLQAGQQIVVPVE